MVNRNSVIAILSLILLVAIIINFYNEWQTKQENEKLKQEQSEQAFKEANSILKKICLDHNGTNCDSFK